MVRLNKLLVPFVLGVLLALWFFSVRYADETDLFASVLRDGLLNPEEVQGDILYGFDDQDFIVESYAVFEDVDSFDILIAYDSDEVMLDTTTIVSSGGVQFDDAGGALSLRVSGFGNLEKGDEIVRFGVDGNLERIVLSDVSVVFVDGSTKKLAIYNATPCLGSECDYHENS